ncbi:MAG: hypothetical protein OEV97_11245, partial [Betaproteobacteria bacterium]|nr:hypothetical protein [Betaproteobacteria bacterium]
SAQGPLGMAELKALIAGKTIDYQSLSDGKYWRAYYENSGQLLVQRDDALEFSGKWSVRADGSHCHSFNDEVCAKIEKNTDGSYMRIVNGVPAFKWLKIKPGKDF